MRRFFFPNHSLGTPVIRLTDLKEIHHLKDVLRFKKDDQILIFNGKGEEVVGTLLSLSKTLIEVRVDYRVPTKKKNGPSVILACAIPKKSKFEFILEKCTELGVDEFIPLLTVRTEINLSKERSAQKLKRYEQVVLNACKQCGRSDMPRVHPAAKFSEIFKLVPSEYQMIIASLKGETKNLAHVFKETTNPGVVFLIGPEGDFTPQEIDSAIAAGAQAVSLGSNVLKVDTAAISMCSFVQLYFAS